MMSQTHILLATALWAKPGQKTRNSAVILGAFVPDLAIYALFAWSKFMGYSDRLIWQELYWQEPWQTYTAAGNSAPLYLLLLIIGVIALRQATIGYKIGLALTFFALAALSHIATDLPVHVEDAHRHFWPLSDWKFISPVSYWNPHHHGSIFSIFEALLGLSLCALLIRRFKNLFVRILLGLLFAAYIAVPLYFHYQMAGH